MNNCSYSAALNETSTETVHPSSQQVKQNYLTLESISICATSKLEPILIRVETCLDEFDIWSPMQKKKLALVCRIF